jgi:hypothetical protein
MRPLQDRDVVLLQGYRDEFIDMDASSTESEIDQSLTH